MADQATNTPLIDLLKGMTADSIEASTSTARRSCSSASPPSSQSTPRSPRTC